MGGSDQALIQIAPHVCICYRNPHHCNTHHCQPTPLTTANLWHPLLPPTTTNHHWCHPPPASTTATTYHGGWWQWGTSVVGGNDGWQLMMDPVGGSGGWLSEKNFFCSKWAKKPKKLHVFFCFIHIWGVGGWVRPKYGYIHIFSLTVKINSLGCDLWLYCVHV